MDKEERFMLRQFLIRQNIIIDQLSNLTKMFAKVNGLAIEEVTNEMELITEDELNRVNE